MSRVDWRRARHISTGREETSRMGRLEGGGDGDGEVGVGGSLMMEGGVSPGEKEFRRLRRDVRMDVMVLDGDDDGNGDGEVELVWDAEASRSVMVGR